MLITAAAQTWNIAETQCTADTGYVIETGGNRKLSYGELADKAAQLPIPPANQLKMKTQSQYKIIGTDKIHIDSPDIVNGKAVFGMDKKVPGMKFAALAMKPAFGASVRSFDDTETLKVKGVIRTLQISDGIAVIADNTWAAFKGVEALQVDWNLGPNANLNSQQITDSMQAKIGNLPALPPNTDKSLEVIYEVPYLAHMTMEPMNATAVYSGGKLEVWTPSQDPQTTRNSITDTLNMNKADVAVYTTLVGGAFGRRLDDDYSIIAATIAKNTGIPVKAVFTRAEDVKHDNYRSASIHAMKGGVDSAGEISGWIHKSVFASYGSSFLPPYKMPSPQTLRDSINAPIPTGAWRSVDNTQVVFANECFFDELAHLGGQDPIDLRLKLITDNRLKDLLVQLKNKSEWTKPLPDGWGRGVALFVGYSAYGGHVVEVSVSKDGELKIERIIGVCDPGIAINPLNIAAQFMGASNDALSTAIKDEITIDKGGVVQSSYLDNDWIRINEVPKFEFYLNAQGTTPSGMGEVGFPSVTPALCNAIFDARGIRIRTLPIRKHDLSTSVEEKKNEEGQKIKLYPNPFTDSFNIEYTGKKTGQIFKIIVSNILGTRIYESVPETKETDIINRKISIPDIADGVYFVSIQSGNSKITERIIKK